MSKKIGVVGVLGGWSSEKLYETIKGENCESLLIEMEDVYFRSDKQSLFYKDTNLMDLMLL